MRRCQLRDILADLDKCNWLILSTRDCKVQVAGFHNYDTICAYRMKARWREPLLAWIDGEGNTTPFQYLRWNETIDDADGFVTVGAVYARPEYVTILQQSSETAQQMGNPR